jgi:hypothetical protein
MKTGHRWLRAVILAIQERDQEDQEDLGLKPDPGQIVRDPILGGKNHHKKRAGGVAQVHLPCQKKKKKEKRKKC